MDPVSVAQISRPLIPIPFSSPVDTITSVSQNSKLSKLLLSAPHVIGSQLLYLTLTFPSFPLSGSQTSLLPILSLGDISVVTIASLAIDSLSLSDIYIRRCRPRILVLGAQSQNVIEPVALVNDFQQRQEAWLRFLSLVDNETTQTAIHKYHVKIEDAIMCLNYVDGSCNRFTHPCELKIIPKDNFMVATTSTNSIFCLDQFDSCGCLS